jgi:dihydrofolate reductase
MVFPDIESAKEYALVQNIPVLFIIGGDSIYQQSLAICHKVYLTRIHHSFEADAFFPALPPQDWKLTLSEAHEIDDKNAYAHTFEVYQNLKQLQ